MHFGYNYCKYSGAFQTFNEEAIACGPDTEDGQFNCKYL